MATDLLDAALASTSEVLGRATTQELGVLDARDLQRFAVAVGAAAEVDPGAVVEAHPLYLTAVLGWAAGPPNHELRPDGTELLATDRVPVDGLRLMGGGQELEFLESPRAGMEVQVETVLEHVEIKEGRSGRLLLMRIVRRYRTTDGVLLAVCTETLMAR
jgi:hydroxyacyl-ACP dehydratase HTD2-like protein with hotdog domain